MKHRAGLETTMSVRKSEGWLGQKRKILKIAVTSFIAVALLLASLGSVAAEESPPISDSEQFIRWHSTAFGTGWYLNNYVQSVIQADDGFVESNGQKVNESETWKEYTGSYIDGRFLIDFLTPEEYFDFIADVYNIDDETLQERLVQFEGFMHDEIMGTKKYLRDFSQGNRQKIGIIGAMIINPKVLLLDEPFNYLDPSSQMTIAHMIQRICKEQGTTVIISSHNLNFVADISSRILLLEKGKLVKDLPNADGAAIAELNEYFGIQAE